MTRDEFLHRVGETLGTSRWFEVDQARINTFADVTEDWQFIHLDPERAAQTPFGGTLAHGYLTLSLLAPMAYDALPEREGIKASINYGFDRIRFLAPVRAGARIRARFDLTGAEAKGEDRLLLRMDVTMEIEGSETPALKADWLAMYLY